MAHPICLPSVSRTPHSRHADAVVGQKKRCTFWLATAWAGLLVTLPACGAADIEAAAQDGLPNNVLAPQPQRMARTNPMAPLHAAPVWRNNNYDPNLWAKGTTQSLAHLPHNQDPFGSPDGTVCSSTCTWGVPVCPLEGAHTPERQDISEGVWGLPMRLVLRIVDTGCKPIQNARVSVSHASPQGAFSGPTATPHTCSGHEPNSLVALAFRGSQRTDARGLVSFDTCFPGALPGRSSVINVEVSLGESVYLSTQVAFNEGLVGDILESHDLYGAHAGSTLLPREDPMLNPSELHKMLMHVAQLQDGTMLAHKTLVLRSNLKAPICPPQSPVPPRAAVMGPGMLPDNF